MKEIKELSNCCKSEVKIGGDDKEGTHYYICTKCNKPCDLYSEIKELSDEELLDTTLRMYYLAGEDEGGIPDNAHNKLRQELLKRLNKPTTWGYTSLTIEKEKAVEEFKKRLIEEIEKLFIDLSGCDRDCILADGITRRSIIDLINKTK